MVLESQTSPQNDNGRLRWCLAVFCLALLLRGSHVFQLSEEPFFDLRLGDAQSYHLWALDIASGNWLGDAVFYQAPLYPYFLGAVYSVLGDDKLAVLLCQALIGALSCVLLTLTGWRLFSKRTGILAGVILALYAPAIFYESLIQKSVLDVFFLCASLWALSEHIVKPRRHLLWFLGLTLGCLVLTRENALAIVAVTLSWLVLKRSGEVAPPLTPLTKRLGDAGLFLAGVVIVLLPVSIRNRAIGGEFHLTTSQLGPNLFIGNNETSDGIYHSLRPMRGDARYEREDATTLAEQAVGRTLTPGEVSSYYVGRVREYMREQPADWTRLMLRKAVLVWNAVEVVDTEDHDTYAEASVPLRLTAYLFHFGVLAPLGLLGVVLTWGQRRQLWPLYLMLATYAASVVVFYVFGRYRLPMVPFLILFAAVALSQLNGLIRSRTSVPPAVGITLLVLFAALCNWPMLDTRAMQSLTRYNFGTGLSDMGDVGAAVSQYRRALELDPTFAEAHSNLGDLLVEQGRSNEAAQHFRDALRVNPDLGDAHNNLGNLLSAEGRLDEAAGHLREAIRTSAEDNAKPHYNLGNVLLQQDALDEAIVRYQAAIRIDPRYANAHYNLGNAWFKLGKLEDAIAQYERTLSIDPQYAEAHNNLGIVFATQGHIARAAEQFERALELDPGYAEARNNLRRATQSP